MTAGDVLFVVITAVLAALAWTWFLTWSIARWGNHSEDEEK